MATPYRVSLSRAAVILRKANGYKTVVELHAQTGFPVSTAYKLEGGKELVRDLMLGTICAYADAIGVPMGELFTLADEIHARTNR